MKGSFGEAEELRRLRELLVSVFTVCMLSPEAPLENLGDLIEAARKEAQRKTSRIHLAKRDNVDVDALGHVVYLWQRTPRYLDSEGRPLPISARGPAPSIQALFRQIDRSKYFERGLKHLIQVKRIRHRSRGLYVPCSEVTICERLSPELISVLSRTISRLVATVLANTSLVNASELRLIERVTTVPDLPVGQTNAFKRFAKDQGGALIDTMNEWLESRRGGKVARDTKGGKRQAAGLHVFAFIDKAP